MKFRGNGPTQGRRTSRLMRRELLAWWLLLLFAVLPVAGCGGGGVQQGLTPSGAGGAAALTPPSPPGPPPAGRIQARDGQVAALEASISLASGWNLIRFPVAQLTALEPGAGMHDGLYAYSPASGSYALVQLTAEAINARGGAAQGFWAYASAATTLGYSGVGTPVCAPLVPGWNLVGMPGPTAGEIALTRPDGTRAGLTHSVSDRTPAAEGFPVHASGFTYEPGAGGYQSLNLGLEATRFARTAGMWLYVYAPAALEFVSPATEELIAPVEASQGV